MTNAISKMNQIYLTLTEETIIDGERLKSSDNYLGAVTEKVANVSKTGMDGCDLSDWLVEGMWDGTQTIQSVANEWDELERE
jgi:hypothetical protein